MPRELPIFPLPLVLFPGATQALHIFEPRYRQMLADCLEGDRRFGIAWVRPQEGPDPEPNLGDIGCIAHVHATHRLADGRSNIVTIGERRFTLEAWIDGGPSTPYRRARVEEFDDEPADPAELAPLAKEVRQGFQRLVKALAILTDRETQAFELPPPDDSARLSFQVASVLELEPDQKQRLLVMRHTGQRLRHLRDVLGPLADDANKRAAVHFRARGNGKGGPNPSIEKVDGEAGGGIGA
ncbi:MAG: LON peptidase substrate-binding domain-containing protein [Gemmatimonadales bacterium]